MWPEENQNPRDREMTYDNHSVQGTNTGDTERTASASDAERIGDDPRDDLRAHGASEAYGDSETARPADVHATQGVGDAVRAEAASHREEAWHTYGESVADARHTSNGNSRPDEAQMRKLVREEIQRNYRPKNQTVSRLLLILVSALLGAGGGAALVATGVVPLPTPSAESVVTQAPSNINITTDNETTVENAVAAKAIPSIVGITTITQGSSNPFIFGSQNYMEAVGSGVIVSSDGYILTNSHVVNSGNAESVKVLLSTGEEQEADVLWADPTLDLAVIKIESAGLPAIEFGDATTVTVGDKAIAIGNPLGLDLQSTLTSGFISGLNRSITLQDGNIMDGLIQTDAAINSGNSGGALLNAKGQLIGINTARPTSADGIGFAIPVSTVQPIVDKIVADGTFEPLYLGITGYNAALASQLGMLSEEVQNGVIVREVVAGSPAAAADIRPGDIITAIDDKPVESMNTLKTILLGYKAGDTAHFTLRRSGEENSLDVTFSDFIPPDDSSTQEEPNTDENSQRESNSLFPWAP